MTLEQIQYFVASAEAGSFSAAGGQLYVSHSTVSRGVAALEKELGTVLLDRSGRRLQCTQAGELFLRESRELLRQAVRMRDQVARFRTRQRLTIVSIDAAMPRIYDLIRRFRREHPEVELVMEQAGQSAVAEKLRRGEADLGILFSFSAPEDPELRYFRAEAGRFCALMSPNHPLADRDRLDPEELDRRPDLLGENPFRVHRDRREESPHDIRSIVMAIRAGGGITVLPEHAAAEFGRGCVTVPVTGGVNEYGLLLGWRQENTSRALEQIIGLARRDLGDKETGT